MIQAHASSEWALMPFEVTTPAIAGAIFPWIWSEISSKLTRRRSRRNGRSGGPKRGVRPSAFGEFGTHAPGAASQSRGCIFKEGLVDSIDHFCSWWIWQPCKASVVPISISESTASSFLGERNWSWLILDEPYLEFVLQYSIKKVTFDTGPRPRLESPTS